MFVIRKLNNFNNFIKLNGGCSSIFAANLPVHVTTKLLVINNLYKTTNYSLLHLTGVNLKDNSSDNKLLDRKMTDTTDRGIPTKEELRQRLTPLQYQVTQEAGTERAFTGIYDKFYEDGVYQCIVCHQDLFTSTTKFDAGCGWPAFNDVLDKGKITLHKDASIAGSNLLLLIKHPERIRTEVRCAKCGAHMGHVFDDGPAPTKKRYCINSASIEFLSAGERK